MSAEPIRYRLIACRCGWRWWSSTLQEAAGEMAIPTVHRKPQDGKPCLRPDCWEIRTFFAVDEGPGNHPRQITEAEYAQLTGVADG